VKTDEPKVVGESFPGACDLAAPARRDVPLDAVVQLAAMICGTPMSTVTVIEGAGGCVGDAEGACVLRVYAEESGDVCGAGCVAG